MHARNLRETTKETFHMHRHRHMVTAIVMIGIAGLRCSATYPRASLFRAVDSAMRTMMIAPTPTATATPLATELNPVNSSSAPPALAEMEESDELGPAVGLKVWPMRVGAMVGGNGH